MGIKAILCRGERLFDISVDAKNPAEAEIGLIIAVIQRAIYDYCESHGSAVSGILVYQQGLRETLKADAERWLFTDDSEPFSFRWCCEAVGIDPEMVRLELAETPKEEMMRRLHMRKIIRHGQPAGRKPRLGYKAQAVQIH